MSFERAAAIEPEDRRRLRKSTLAPGPTVQLRVAKRSAPDRVKRIIELAYTLLGETEALGRDKAFTEASLQLKSLDIVEGIDFYKEVERFETGLIKLALDHTRGCQAKAARLLGIKPTTLNSKIKLLGIQY
jgi:DNA-binding NtrC family response regulator